MPSQACIKLRIVFVSDGWHSRCWVVQRRASCLEHLLITFFSQDLVRAVQNHSPSACLSLMLLTPISAALFSPGISQPPICFCTAGPTWRALRHLVLCVDTVFSCLHPSDSFILILYRANVWGERLLLSRKTRTARNFQEHENVFQLACVTHDTSTISAGQTLPHELSAIS